MRAYRLHEVHVAPARPSSEIWRLLVGVVAIVFGFLILNLGYIEILQGLPDWAALNRELHHGTSARALWVMLLNFLPLLMMLWVVLTLLHRRSLRRMAGPWTLVRLDFRRTARLLVVLYAVVLILPAPAGMSPMQNMPFADWIWLLPVSLPLILLQTSTEEFLFRGYLQSQLAARFSSPLVWMVLPSLLFGFLHYDPATYGPNALPLAAWSAVFGLAAADLTARFSSPLVWMVLPSLLFGFLHYDPATYGPNALPLAAWSAVFGLAAADLTARAGNLGPALALHFLNNVVAMSFTSMEGHWDGLALFVLPFGPENVDALRATMPLEILLILCGWLTVRIAIRR